MTYDNQTLITVSLIAVSILLAYQYGVYTGRDRAHQKADNIIRYFMSVFISELAHGLSKEEEALFFEKMDGALKKTKQIMWKEVNDGAS